MASASDFLQESSLKAPAIEVVDLSSDRDSVDGTRDERRDDASVDVEDDDDDDDGDLSLYEDALDGILDESESNENQLVDTCTVEESHAFRKRLRLVGQDQFIVETIENETITAKKLCTAFGIRPPAFLEGEPDQAYYPLLGLGITRELSKRIKLPAYNTIDDAVALLVRSKNIIVLTGAGISTSLGIPDFRSKHTGLYSQLEHLGLSEPQEVFDIRLFREDPSIFYSVAKDILPSTNKFSPTHAFIKLLQDKHKLLTNFTQNIDNLEHHAGIFPERLIQCHGSFATATCVECKYRVAGQEIYKDLKAGRVARCDRCIRVSRQLNSAGVKRKRSMTSFAARKKKRAEYEDSTDDEEYDIAVAGVMKPDITFFGEDLPEAFHDRLVHHDREKVDLVLVIGTSLKVAPVSEVSGIIPPEVPQMYISREPCQHVDFDIDMFGDCDTVVTELCRRAGWDLQHEMIKSNSIDIKQQDGYDSRFTFHIKKA